MNSTLLKKIKNVEGFLRPDEAQLLYQLAKNSPGKGVIVEIGSFKGKSTICLAWGSKQGPQSQVYAVDPHTGSKEHRQKSQVVNTFKDFQKNLHQAGVASWVKPIVKTSLKAAKNFKKQADLIFIDANHQYQAVKQDFQAWFPLLKNGGVMAFHDTLSWPGPRKVVEKYLFHSYNFKKVKVIGSITYGQKSQQVNWLDKIQKFYILTLMQMRRKILQFKLPTPVKKLAKRIYYALECN